MAIRVVRLGSARSPNEGPRIGTVRRPPRGVPKTDFASGDWFDTWLPALAPSAELLRSAPAIATDADWNRFARSYRRAMNEPDRLHLLDLLAILSHRTNFSVGC